MDEAPLEPYGLSARTTMIVVLAAALLDLAAAVWNGRHYALDTLVFLVLVPLPMLPFVLAISATRICNRSVAIAAMAVAVWGLAYYTEDAQPGWELLIGPLILLPFATISAVAIAWMRRRQIAAMRR